MAFKVSIGSFDSSIKYSRSKYGIARNIRIRAGLIVQINSILWASFIF